MTSESEALAPTLRTLSSAATDFSIHCPQLPHAIPSTRVRAVETLSAMTPPQYRYDPSLQQ
jgi:hypothetical protein